MPLLANIGAVRPEARGRRLTGRAWTTFDSIFGADGARSDTFFRVGTEVTYENPFGRGGALFPCLGRQNRGPHTDQNREPPRLADVCRLPLPLLLQLQTNGAVSAAVEGITQRRCDGHLVISQVTRRGVFSHNWRVNAC